MGAPRLGQQIGLGLKPPCVCRGPVVYGSSEPFIYSPCTLALISYPVLVFCHAVRLNSTKNKGSLVEGEKRGHQNKIPAPKQFIKKEKSNAKVMVASNI